MARCLAVQFKKWAWTIGLGWRNLINMEHWAPCPKLSLFFAIVVGFLWRICEKMVDIGFGISIDWWWFQKNERKNEKMSSPNKLPTLPDFEGWASWNHWTNSFLLNWCYRIFPPLPLDISLDNEWCTPNYFMPDSWRSKILLLRKDSVQVHSSQYIKFTKYDKNYYITD